MTNFKFRNINFLFCPQKCQLKQPKINFGKFIEKWRKALSNAIKESKTIVQKTSKNTRQYHDTKHRIFLYTKYHRCSKWRLIPSYAEYKIKVKAL